MLTEDQIEDLWERKISAEVPGLYFGDLTTRYTLQKQWITGLLFFLSSGAAATVVAKLPSTVPIVFSTIGALLSAYAVSVGLDSKVRTMAKLHYSWTQLSNEYRKIWNHTYFDTAEYDLTELQERELNLSELGTTDAPNDPKRMGHWQDQVFKMNRLENA